MVLEMSYSSRNIGDVFYTLRLDSTLNGAVPADGAEFNASDFDPDELKNPYSLCINNRIASVDYATYESRLKTDGCCAAFGIDTVNGMFRVPTFKNIFIEAGDTSTIAQYKTPGLPNIIGNFQGWNDANGAFWVWGSGIWDGKRNPYYQRHWNGFDASRSSKIYGASDTVQPRAIMLRPMVQLLSADGVANKDEEIEEPIIPPGSLKVPYIFIPGTEAKALEVNANFEYVLRAIENSDAMPVVHIAGKETIVGQKTFKAPVTVEGIELMPSKTASHGGCIDFHFEQANNDYTARLVEVTKGHLAINQSPPDSDSSTKIATTEFVKRALAAEQKKNAYVVDSYANGNSWFRVWSDGFIQQGGVTAAFTSNPASIILLKPFRDTYYSLVCTPQGSSNIRGWTTAISSKSSSAFSVCCGWGTNEGVSSAPGSGCSVSWLAQGY